ncbi:myosin-8 isoform X1 [Syngnathoides biaculeatus]|uniref:myosin-8 isoform X1 n=1 Tax=Syngnathoides biaculeatus TaxID=300417 RepID=UPI002ADD84BC|nr:myosin-8 isoform X1 [Syngnathoides biaculeatus]
MTAKHRKGKGNHKHEEDHVKSDIPESEVRSGGNSHAFALFLCLVVVFGGATGTWFCYQQHLTMTHLTESLTGMQMKVVKLQASQETARQTNDMVHFSTDVESRLNALEESYAMAQKQVDGALASTEHLKALDLPAQVLSLHTEVKSRLAEIQQSVASAADLTQLQAKLQREAEELEGVRLQVEGLVTSSADLSKQVQAAMGRVEKAEAVLDDVDSLRHILKKQTAHLMGLQIELKSYQTEMAAFRESLETERSAQFQQADVEEQISAVRMSVQEQNSTTGNLHAELRAQLDNLQKQVSQIAGAGKSVPEPMQKAKGEPATVVEKEEEAAEKRSNLVAVESGTDEPVEEASDDKASSTEHMEQSLTSPETAETPGTDAEGEEVILSDKKRFVEELPLDKGEAHPEEDDYDDDDDRSAEQDESEEELDNDEL